MSSPMYDLPEHFLIPVNKDGDGPAEEQDTVDYVCACGDPECELR